jgi:hypothetical protein
MGSVAAAERRSGDRGGERSWICVAGAFADSGASASVANRDARAADTLSFEENTGGSETLQCRHAVCCTLSTGPFDPGGSLI